MNNMYLHITKITAAKQVICSYNNFSHIFDNLLVNWKVLQQVTARNEDTLLILTGRA